MILTSSTTTPALLPVLYNGGSPYAPQQQQAAKQDKNETFSLIDTENLEIYSATGKSTNVISRTIAPQRGVTVDIYI